MGRAASATRRAGIRTETSPPGSVTVKSPPAVMLRSTGGGSDVGVAWIETATRNCERVPLASSSSPDRTCRPSESEPVAKVSVEPEMVGTGAAMPSSSAPGAVTGSFAVSTIWFADVDTVPSAGVDEMRVGAVLSKRTFVRSAGAEALSTAS